VFKFAICRPKSVRPSVVCRLSSVVCLSVTFVRPNWRLKFSAMFLRHLVPWPSVDIQVTFYEDRPRGTPSSGKLNATMVGKYSDFGPVEGYIWETVQHMSFLLVTESMTLNDLERRNGRYIALFHCVPTHNRFLAQERKFTFAISSADELLVSHSVTSTTTVLLTGERQTYAHLSVLLVCDLSS